MSKSLNRSYINVFRLWWYRRQHHFDGRLLWSSGSNGRCFLWFHRKRENGLFEKMPWWIWCSKLWNGSNDDDGILQKSEYFLCRKRLIFIWNSYFYQHTILRHKKVICVTYLNRLLGDRNAEQEIDSSDFEMRPLRVVLEYIKTQVTNE